MQFGCLNTMEICRSLNHKNVFDPTYCGLPIYMKPFSNKGKILDTYRRQTGNGICLHFRECNPNWKQVYGCLRRMKINSKKMLWWDSKARIKKSKAKMDVFRFWWINQQDFENRILSQTLIPYITFSGSVEPKKEAK